MNAANGIPVLFAIGTNVLCFYLPQLWPPSTRSMTYIRTILVVVACVTLAWGQASDPTAGMDSSTPDDAGMGMVRRDKILVAHGEYSLLSKLSHTDPQYQLRQVHSPSSSSAPSLSSWRASFEPTPGSPPMPPYNYSPSPSSSPASP